MRRAEQHAERDGPLAITLRSAAHTRTKADHTSVHTICSLLGLAPRTDTRARACRAAGRTREGGRREGRDITLRLEVWQLRHDWVVLLRRRLRWSMSMEKSRSSRSPFMTCVCADSANMAGTDGADGGGAAATTTTTTATRRTRGGSVLAQGTE